MHQLEHSVPLATMLATGDFFAADQFTRDNLIKIAGATSQVVMTKAHTLLLQSNISHHPCKKIQCRLQIRGFVYWTEVKNLPEQDLCTMERLW